MIKIECFFERRNLLTFKFASLPNWQGAKNAGGTRPFSSNCNEIASF